MQLFNSVGKIGVAAQADKTGHAIVGHVRQCQAEVAVRHDFVMVNAQTDARQMGQRRSWRPRPWELASYAPLTGMPEISTGHHQTIPVVAT